MDFRFSIDWQSINYCILEYFKAFCSISELLTDNHHILTFFDLFVI